MPSDLAELLLSLEAQVDVLTVLVDSQQELLEALVLEVQSRRGAPITPTAAETWPCLKRYDIN